MPADKPRVEGEHYWITRKSLPGVTLCKWCSNTRGPATARRRCPGILPTMKAEAIEGEGR